MLKRRDFLIISTFTGLALATATSLAQASTVSPVLQPKLVGHSLHSLDDLLRGKINLADVEALYLAPAALQLLNRSRLPTELTNDERNAAYAEAERLFPQNANLDHVFDGRNLREALAAGNEQAQAFLQSERLQAAYEARQAKSERLLQEYLSNLTTQGKLRPRPAGFPPVGRTFWTRAGQPVPMAWDADRNIEKMLIERF